MNNIDNLIEQLSGLTLLYVEDNEEARKSTFLILEDLFENIVVAVDGFDGIEKFKNNNIDIVITDIYMPNMDGLEMSKNIKEINSSMPIIILTAITDISIIKESIDIGVDSFINKPLEDIDFLINKLYLIVNKILYKKREEEIFKIKHDNEKMKLLTNTMKNIAHHWRQPLNIISTISSLYTLKVEQGEKLTLEDLQRAEIITQKTQELSLLLDKIEKIEINKISSKDITELISISNPINIVREKNEKV